MLDYEARSNINYSVIFGPNGFNERSNEKYWQRFSDYICICCNFFIHSKTTLFGGKIGVKYVCPLLLGPHIEDMMGL